MSATHLHTDADPADAAKPAGPWLALSAALSDQLPALAGRDDLMVACTPGAGRGAPGCFLPALATVELNGNHLGVDPATCEPARPSDRERYPALWGVLIHEAAHAAHTAWHPPDGAPGEPIAYVQAAVMLEETRIEAAQLARRPSDRHWLRAATTKLILADFTPTSAPGHGPAAAMTPWDASRAAALLLARVDAGVLDEDETTKLTEMITTVLGTDRLEKLRAIWRQAHSTADTDTAAMLDLGRRWCQAVDRDPDQPVPPDAGTGQGGQANPAVSGQPRPAPVTPLAAAIAATLTDIGASDSPPSDDHDRQRERARQRGAERQARERAHQAAQRVFTRDPATHDEPTGKRRTSSPITATRQPTGAEQGAAARLARALRAAAHRERATTRVNSPTPPGRLRMRAVLAADAQRAAGATVTSEPFTQTRRRHTPSPPLRVGIACDISGSMRPFERPLASAAFILARATSHIGDARSATVLFGERVHPLTHPGGAPTAVREFTARDSTEEFCEAVDALDAALDLSRPGAARLLVVVSDAGFTSRQRYEGIGRITRLTAAGCGVLWLAPSTRTRPLGGVQTIALTTPTDAANAIATAATRALREAAAIS